MAFKKSPAQAQKSGPKSAAEAGKKAPPSKKPQAAKADDDDDLDEEDDDFSMDEDSDLSGADEDLDDEELDDEDLDDEELDDEELDDEELDEESEDEDVPALKATKQASAASKAQGQQQKSPVKQSQSPKEKVPVVAAVNGKRKAEWEAGSSPAKKIRLEDHIPASFVVDYEARDLCDVKLASFPDGVTNDDVKKLCKDGTVVREIVQNKKLVCAFVRYPNKEKAVAAVRSLRGTNLKGVPFKVSYCGERWTNPASCPQFQPDTLDVRRVPKEYQDKQKLAALFPTGEVLKVQRDGYAQVKFPSSEVLIKALKNPKCRTINGKNLEFSVALVPKRKHTKAAGFKENQNAVLRPQNKKARNAAKQEAEAAKTPTKGQTPSKQPSSPTLKGSPHTPTPQKKQRRKRSKTPGQQAGPRTPGQQGGPKTPGQQGGPKTPGQQGGPKTPGQQGGPKTPGQQGGPKTPGQQGGPKTPGQQGGPKTPGQQGGPKTPKQQGGPKTPKQQGGPKTPGQQGGPKTPGQRGSKTPGQAKGGAKTPKGTPKHKTPGMKGTPARA
ncbi:uncharacterized protein LOC142582038 [Dermacentor variabilis]|uniref:uncharacterized protein LOC142582038 n=1 Tax=Dermacentor variabilis TaxID=34621 RepID=UPI003F5C50B1